MVRVSDLYDLKYKYVKININIINILANKSKEVNSKLKLFKYIRFRFWYRLRIDWLSNNKLKVFNLTELDL